MRSVWSVAVAHNSEVDILAETKQHFWKALAHRGATTAVDQRINAAILTTDL